MRIRFNSMISRPVFSTSTRTSRLRPSLMMIFKVPLRTLDTFKGFTHLSSTKAPFEMERICSISTSCWTLTKYSLEILEEGWITFCAKWPSFVTSKSPEVSRSRRPIVNRRCSKGSKRSNTIFFVPKRLLEQI